MSRHCSDCTYLLPNKWSTDTVKNYFPPMTMTVYRFGVDPLRIELTPVKFMTSREVEAHTRKTNMADNGEQESPLINSSAEIDIEGDITVPGAPDSDDEPSTLDEPVSETLKRDAKAVGKKFFHVLWPRETKTLLREWDLWGPLVLCIFLAVMLQGSHSLISGEAAGGPEFAEVFIIVWIGASLVTLNSKLLGGTLSFFQSVCVLGYCVLPLDMALLICRLILIAEHTTILFAVRFIIVILAFAWATFASVKFLGDSQPLHRKALAVYPIFLFYFVISWLVISHST